MKVALIAGSPGVPVQGPSGSSAHLRGLARGLGELGHDVRVWATRLSDRRGSFGEPVVGARETGVPGWPSWLERWRDLTEIRAARRLSRAVIEAAHAGDVPELLIERHSLYSDAGWRISDRLGLPWVLEVNAPLAMERSRYEVLRTPRLAARWERDVLRAAPVVVAVSGWLVSWLREEIGCSNVIRVLNGTDAGPGDRARGRAALGLRGDEPAVGFVGSMKPWHGLERAARVASALGARLVLIGPEPADPPGGALLTGHLGPAALADAVAALDLGLAPYPPDAPPWFCPLKILDYRAQGTPVLATDRGEARALVGEGGAVVPPDDEAALIEEGRAWLGRRAAPWLRSWRHVASEVLVAARAGRGLER